MTLAARLPSLDPPPNDEAPTLERALRTSPPANDAAPSAHQQAVLRRASRAIHDGRVCVIRYASEPGGAPSVRAIEPLAVTTSRGALGLLAWCRLRRDLRTFRLDRIGSITVDAERFEKHPGLALERFIQHRRRELP